MTALVLLSGGLDSILAARLVSDQDINVICLNFVIPFSPDQSGALSFPGFEIKHVDIKDKFLELVRSPRYGYGSNMNPCIDCKIFMLNQARELMGELGASFIVTGEVLGQRPMSQNRQSLDLIERMSGLTGLLLRPLSAKLLKPTQVETNGWIDREKLLGLNGRSRRPQMDLAKKFNLTGYSNPAGGCLLTDPMFSRRLKDIIANDRLSLNSIELLKVGRHFRLSKQAKLVTGRNEKENDLLLGLAQEGSYIFKPEEDTAGPVALGIGEFNEDLIRLSCRITGRYCDLSMGRELTLIYKRLNGSPAMDPEGYCRINVEPLKDSALESLRV